MTAEQQLLRDWVVLGNEYRKRRAGLEVAESDVKDHARALLAYHRAGLALTSLELAMIERGEAVAAGPVEP